MCLDDLECSSAFIFKAMAIHCHRRLFPSTLLPLINQVRDAKMKFLGTLKHDTEEDRTDWNKLIVHLKVKLPAPSQIMSFFFVCSYKLCKRKVQTFLHMFGSRNIQITHPYLRRSWKAYYLKLMLRTKFTTTRRYVIYTCLCWKNNEIQVWEYLWFLSTPVLKMIRCVIQWSEHVDNVLTFWRTLKPFFKNCLNHLTMGFDCVWNFSNWSLVTPFPHFPKDLSYPLFFAHFFMVLLCSFIYDRRLHSWLKFESCFLVLNSQCLAGHKGSWRSYW